jgi:hypothetical protein
VLHSILARITASGDITMTEETEATPGSLFANPLLAGAAAGRPFEGLGYDPAGRVFPTARGVSTDTAGNAIAVAFGLVCAPDCLSARHFVTRSGSDAYGPVQTVPEADDEVAAIGGPGRYVISTFNPGRLLFGRAGGPPPVGRATPRDVTGDPHLIVAPLPFVLADGRAVFLTTAPRNRRRDQYARVGAVQIAAHGAPMRSILSPAAHCDQGVRGHVRQAAQVFSDTDGHVAVRWECSGRRSYLRYLR